MGQDITLDAMSTNVSHKVSNLEFHYKGSEKSVSSHMLWKRIKQADTREKAKDIYSRVKYLDGESFISEKKGEAPQHFLRVTKGKWLDGEYFYTYLSADVIKKLDPEDAKNV